MKMLGDLTSKIAFAVISRFVTFVVSLVASPLIKE